MPSIQLFFSQNYKGKPIDQVVVKLNWASLMIFCDLISFCFVQISEGKANSAQP